MPSGVGGPTGSPGPAVQPLIGYVWTYDGLRWLAAPPGSSISGLTTARIVRAASATTIDSPSAISTDQSINTSNATSASSSTVGAVTIGNGTAATNVAIGGGNVVVGGRIGVQISPAASFHLAADSASLDVVRLDNTNVTNPHSWLMGPGTGSGTIFGFYDRTNAALVMYFANAVGNLVTIACADGLAISSTTEATSVASASVALTGGLGVPKRSYLGTIGAAFKGNVLAGVQDGTAASAGQVGEVLSSTVSTYTNYTTTATYQQITSLALTAGDWEVFGFIGLNANGSTLTVTANAIGTISTVTASATGVTEGSGDIGYISQVINAASGKDSLYLHKTLNLAVGATYYLNSQATFTLGNPQFVGSLFARRIR